MMTEKEFKQELRDKIVIGISVITFGILVLSGVAFWCEHIARWFR